ncbi:CopG family transcriptional regulator [Acidipropionibacterium virtanenii]|uniref:Uncharacterized protein n=1 Tax=Acidipropionibacterium virtanenii TaxID=2057246 RepID=A0A344UWT4_9ACTN|nr:CopG family transcriptional regulator [Acidipropionibacterium virtanenii]AXE39732.1 hypothetical protein JS278_02594 [Acidipropionibacterium virtanenii]
MSDLTPEQLDEITADFEAGWSEHRLDAAEVRWGPGFAHVLPDDVRQALHRRALDEGLTDAELIERAVRAYLAA